MFPSKYLYRQKLPFGQVLHEQQDVLLHLETKISLNIPRLPSEKLSRGEENNVKNSKAVRLLYVITVSILAPLTALAQQPQVVKGEYIVKMKSRILTATSMSQKVAGHGALKGAFKSLNMYHISLKPGTDEQQSLNDLRQDPDVEYVEPNYRLDKSDSGDSAPGQIVRSFSRDEIEQMSAGDVSASSSSSGTYSQSAAPTRTADAWGIASAYSGTNEIIVAIVDTGLDKNHKVFLPYHLAGGVNTGGTGGLWVNTMEASGVTGVDDDSNGFVDDINGWNFINGTNNFYDDDGHGTHVSGIVVGAGVNIFSNNLSHSKILVMPLKFLDANGSGATSNAIRAIYYAVDNGARVINNSWGGSSYSRALHEALTYAYNHQVTIVTAAGNYSKNNDSVSMYPANYDVPSNISVAATTDNDALAYFSNYGHASVHIGSPGMNINSTIPGNYYGYLSGTSMAAPFVAGMAAMALSESPNLTGYQVKNLMLAQADNDPSLSAKTVSSGRINAFNLVQGSQGMIFASAFQPAYSPDYSSLDQASTSSSGGGGGCGTVSSAMLTRTGFGAGGNGPMGVLGGLLLLPLLVWAVLRRRAASPQSRRQHERFRMNSEVRVKIGDRELVGAMNTISAGGVSFSVDEALEKGGVVTMRIQSPNGKESIEVQGEVVWSERNQAYGVRFSEAHQGVQAMIKHWTRSLMKT